MAAFVAMENKKTFGGPFKIFSSGIGMGVGIQIQTLSFTQYKSLL